ncbi:MAG: hypothetical protein KA220_11010 [Phenylobacterium sp.]|nr:hypothetical protein [Phenylobacterium sp.]
MMGLDGYIGLLGAALILGAYAGVQMKKLDPHDLPALLLNLGGASLVIVSLFFEFNLAAFLLEVAWVGIAVAGLFGWLRKRQQKPETPPAPAGTPDA